MLEEHNKLVNAINMVSVAFFADDFAALQDELEATYRHAGESDSSRLAFEDALYAIMCERNG